MKKTGRKKQTKDSSPSRVGKPRSQAPESQKKSKVPARKAPEARTRRTADPDDSVRDRPSDRVRPDAELRGILAEQRRLEKDLTLFRKLMDLSNDALFVVDPRSGRFLDVNVNACKSLGYTRKELLGLQVSDISARLHGATAWKEIVAEITRKPSRLRESEHRRKDGSTFPVEISIRYVSLDDSSYVIGLARDISERKRREAIAHQNEERLRSIAETVTDVIYRLDPEGYVTYVSPSVQTVLGFTVSETVGKNFTDFIHPEDLQKAVRAYELLLQGTSFMDLDLRVLRK
jgi:PAS domain S-box-containing protein